MYTSRIIRNVGAAGNRMMNEGSKGPKGGNNNMVGVDSANL